MEGDPLGEPERNSWLALASIAEGVRRHSCCPHGSRRRLGLGLGGDRGVDAEGAVGGREEELPGVEGASMQPYTLTSISTAQAMEGHRWSTARGRSRSGPAATMAAGEGAEE